MARKKGMGGVQLPVAQKIVDTWTPVRGETIAVSGTLTSSSTASLATFLPLNLSPGADDRIYLDAFYLNVPGTNRWPVLAVGGTDGPRLWEGVAGTQQSMTWPSGLLLPAGLGVWLNSSSSTALAAVVNGSVQIRRERHVSPFTGGDSWR